MVSNSPMLIVEKGASDASVVVLDSSSHVLGKSPKADTSFHSPFVSHRHAEVQRDGSEFLIRDLGSKNGTTVNGDLVGGEFRSLQNGDRIELAGGEVILRFQTSATTLTLKKPAARSGMAPGIVVDNPTREVFVGGSIVEPPLSKKEFDVLSLLYREKGKACSKDEIARWGWPERKDGDVGDQEIEQCIRRIRVRVEPSPSSPVYLVTLRGFGYKLIDPS